MITPRWRSTSSTSRTRCGSSARRGVEFDDVDAPGLRTVEKIADIDGNYPSKGTAERGAWFRDSEGNLIGIGQTVH